MTLDARLRDRLMKTLELARNGVGGEKANAQTILEKLLRAHGLTVADLEQSSKDVDWLWIRGRDDDERLVICGLFYSIGGRDLELFERREAKYWTGAKFTAAERATIKVMWDVYRPAWRKSVHDLSLAFIGKHRLVFERDPDAPTRTETAEDRAAGRRRAQMMMGLDHVERPVTRLGGAR
jgi:hypothetical protein